MNKNTFTLIAISFFLLFSCSNASKQHSSNEPLPEGNSKIYMFVGTYTQKDSKGIYVYMLDTINATIQPVSSASIQNPSYIALNKNGDKLYCVTENEDSTSLVSSFNFNKEKGTLSLINSVAALGAAPCYIALDHSEKLLTTANYLSGSCSIFEIGKDGEINNSNANANVFSFSGKGINQRQDKPHIHCTMFSPDNKYMFATDLGTDKIHKFEVNSDNKTLTIGKPAAFDIAAGSGPRHITFHPNGKFAYLINELSGDVTCFQYQDGNMVQFQTIKADTLNAGGSADIHISPNGKFLYSSNRLKGDGIAIFSIDETDGKLLKVGYQPTELHPRNFAITPNGKFLLVACRDADVIQLFSIDNNTGLLKDMHKNIEVSMPVCIKFTSAK